MLFTYKGHHKRQWTDFNWTHMGTRALRFHMVCRPCVNHGPGKIYVKRLWGTIFLTCVSPNICPDFHFHFSMFNNHIMLRWHYSISMGSKNGRHRYRNALRMRQPSHVHVFSCIKFVKHYCFQFMKGYFNNETKFCDTLMGPHVCFHTVCDTLMGPQIERFCVFPAKGFINLMQRALLLRNQPMPGSD